MEAAVKLPQHMEALQQANRVRLARSALTRKIASGEVSVTEVLAEVPWEAASMGVGALLMAQHRWGRTRMRRALLACGLAENKALGSMTERQRRVLANYLATGQEDRWA